METRLLRYSLGSVSVIWNGGPAATLQLVVRRSTDSTPPTLQGEQSSRLLLLLLLPIIVIIYIENVMKKTKQKRLFPSLLRSFYPHLILTTWANHSRSATPTDRQKKSGRVRASYRSTRTYIRKYVYFPFKLRNVRAFLVRPSSGNHLIDRDVTAPFASHFFHPVFSIDLSFLTTEMFFILFFLCLFIIIK